MDTRADDPLAGTLGARRASYKRDAPTGSALCLSGGGFRAVFFHLGALRCLNDLGLLARIDAISAVSGGSIVAAHLATALTWPTTAPLSAEAWETQVAGPLRRFASRDRRTGPIVKGLGPTTTMANELAKQFDELFAQRTLQDLPVHPKVVICATNLSHGALWRFQREQIGDEVFGFEAPPRAATSLAAAVSASATLAPYFAPFRLTIRDVSTFAGGRRRQFNVGAFDGDATLLLSDGGVYDNLGLEAVWQTYRNLLVSDGGAPLTHEWDGRWFGRLKSVWRIVNLNDQLGRLARRRWFISRVEEGNIPGAYWGISSAVADITHAGMDFPGYSAGLVRQVIAQTRTDLDAFTETEQRVLENHGYSLASAALQTWGAPALQLPADPQLLALPHGGEYLDETWVRRELVADRSRWRRAWRSVRQGVAGRVHRLATGRSSSRAS